MISFYLMRKLQLFIFLLIASHSLFAQDLVVYYEAKLGTSQTDTVMVYLQSLKANTLEVSNLTLSLCYPTNSQLQLNNIQSTLATTLGKDYEYCGEFSEPVVYDGIQYAKRCKYGIATLGTGTVTVPNFYGTKLLVLKVPFSTVASGGGQYYIETNLENPINEIGDHQGNSLDFAVQNAQYPFPVELVHFQANKQLDGTVAIEWATASELNHAYFEVQKGTDGLSFDEIATVSGAGNTQEYRSYSVVDEGIMQAVNFYRLKQVDQNGEATYSEVVEVRFSQDASSPILAFPNPASSFLEIRPTQTLQSDLELALIDLTGRTLLTQTHKVNSLTTQIDLGNLPSGTYLLKATDGIGTFSLKRIVKN